MIEPQSNVFNPVFTTWFWCAFCFDRHDMKFLRDEGIYEVYECQHCRRENKKAVR